MANLLEQGSAWLEAQRHTHATSPVTYRRGALSVALNATVGRTKFEQASAAALDEVAVSIQSESRDYLLRALDLLIGGVAVTPARGDTIEETIGAQVFVHEVLPLGAEPPWRWSDPHHQTI